MKDLNLTPDDPRITAYALGELEGEELAAVEAAVRRDPKLLALITEIRVTSVQLEAALAAEPDADSIAFAAAHSTMRDASADEYRRVKRGPVARLFAFPQIYFVISGAAAACFAVIVILHGPPPAAPKHPQAPHYVQVPIAFEPAERRGDAGAPMTVSVGGLMPPPPATPSVTALPPATPGDPSLASSGGSSSKAPEPIPAAGAHVAVDSTSMPAPTPQAASSAVALSEPARPAADEKPARELGRESAAATVAAVTPPPSPVAAPEGGDRAEAALGRATATEMRAAAPSRGVTITFADPSISLGLPQPAAGSGFTKIEAKRPSDARDLAAITTSYGASVPSTGAGAPPRALNSAPKVSAPTPADDTVVRFDTFTSANSQERGAAAARLGYATSAGRATASGRKPAPPRGALFYAKGNAQRAATPDNDFLGVEENPKSSFPVDVNKDSYDQIRRAIALDTLPARDDVRIEELINFFPYRYAPPPGRDDAPVAAALEVAEAPWARSHRLVRVALKGREPAAADRLSAIAKDVKVEVIFNAAKISSYRLIGFENPRLNPDDFDRAGGVDLAAGHTITALYEVIPLGLEAARVADKPAADNPLYQRGVVVTSRLEMPDQEEKLTNELLLVNVGYRKPDSLFNLARHAPFRLIDGEQRFETASADFKFAAAVAEYGMILRHSPHRGNATLGDVLAWASAGAGSNADDPRGHRSEFLSLVRRTQALLR